MSDDINSSSADALVAKIMAELRRLYPNDSIEFMLFKELHPPLPDEPKEWADTPLIVVKWGVGEEQQEITVNVSPQFIKYWDEDFERSLANFRQARAL